MICLAIGLGALGFFAARAAHRRSHGCHAQGHYGHWGRHGGWGGWGGDHDDPFGGGGAFGGGGGPPWARHRRHGRHRRWMLHAMLARIDASPAQERVIINELDKLEERMHAAKRDLRETRGDLGAALRGPVLDDAALGAVLGRVDGATTEARTAILDTLRAVHAVLDERQRNDLADLLERGLSGGWRGDRGGHGWRGRGPGGPGGPYRT